MSRLVSKLFPEFPIPVLVHLLLHSICVNHDLLSSSSSSYYLRKSRSPSHLLPPTTLIQLDPDLEPLWYSQYSDCFDCWFRVFSNLLNRFLGKLNMLTAGRWRTAFLSLRDEILTIPPRPLPLLLEDLLFSQSHSIISAVSLLPPHELTSDCLFLLDLVSKADGPDWIPVARHTCQLVPP